MKHRYDAVVDPAPFREWCDSQIREAKAIRKARAGDYMGAEARVQSAQDLAARLGLDERRLYAWRYENRGLDRLNLEDALLSAGVGIWELYDEDELGNLPEPAPEDVKPFRNPPGINSKLSDERLRILHRFHLERKVSIVRIGEEIWEQTGFASATSARSCIAKGFNRLGLPIRVYGVDGLGARRCVAQSKRSGKPCKIPPLRGQDLCRVHHPDYAEEVKRIALAALPSAPRVYDAAETTTKGAS